MMIRILFWIALGTAALSLLVSLLSWLTTSIAGVALNVPTWSWLMATAFVLCVFAFFRARRQQQMEPRVVSIAVGEIRPAWLAAMVLFCLLFIVVNAGLMFLSSEGHPVMDGGQMVLVRHGRIIRTLSAAEFAREEARGLRFMLGFCAFIAALAAALLNRPAPVPRPAPSPTGP